MNLTTLGRPEPSVSRMARNCTQFDLVDDHSNHLLSRRVRRPLHGGCIQVHSLRVTDCGWYTLLRILLFRVPFVDFQFGLLDKPFSKMDLTASLSRSSYHTSRVECVGITLSARRCSCATDHGYRHSFPLTQLLILQGRSGPCPIPPRRHHRVRHCGSQPGAAQKALVRPKCLPHSR